jgi:hypothetical protein
LARERPARPVADNDLNAGKAMTDHEFEERYKKKRYIVISRHEHSGSTLEELVNQAMRFGFRPHGSMLIPEPRSYFQAGRM